MSGQGERVAGAEGTTFATVDLIEKKRDRGSLAADEIGWLIDGFTTGEIPDYQMAAMAMAVVLNGLDGDELAAWTQAMLESGDRLDFSHIDKAKVDKHSTGGVGDKISIPLAPLVAACGVAVPMISGRGLGHTGGTLDKLESIPGFRTRLDPAEFRAVLEECGMVMGGQTATLVPTDRKLYALRDATGTVPSIPLIASSILSKKLAEGLDGLVLDVKFGSGAFMTEPDMARELAETMVGIGAAHDVAVTAFLTNMSQPLGRAVGNANEIRESIAVLQGNGPDDVVALTLALGEEMLHLAGIEGGRAKLEKALRSGEALEVFERVIARQGGDPAVIDDPSLLMVSTDVAELAAPRGGFVTRCDARVIGVSATRLGAGRLKQEDDIDPSVGIEVLAKIGDRVEPGQPLARVAQGKRRWIDAAPDLPTAWEISEEPISPPELVKDRIRRES